MKTLYLCVIHLFGDTNESNKIEKVKLLISNALDNMEKIRNPIQKNKQRCFTVVSDPNGSYLCGFSGGLNIYGY